jgi:hypothetical protein
MNFRPVFYFQPVNEKRFFEAGKIHFSALTRKRSARREDACNRITADLPETPGSRGAQFDTYRPSGWRFSATID